jgi:WD40 repeat protein
VWETQHHARIDALAWSAEGDFVASGSADGTVRLWGPTGKLIAGFDGHSSEVWSVAVHKDGRRVLSSGKDGSIRLWDRKGGAPRVWRYERLGYGSAAVCFAPDGRRAAWGANDGTVRVWDLDADRELLRLDVGGVWVRALGFSPGGKRLLAGSYVGEDGTLSLFDAQSGRLLDFLRQRGGPTGLAFTPDGRRAVVSHADGRARVWRLPEP